MAIIDTQADYELAASKGFSANWTNITGFAEACFNENALDDLLDNNEYTTAVDCKAWGISPDEHKQAIKEAIEASMAVFDAKRDEDDA